MTPLVECVPNISEGRDAGRVRAIVDEVAGVPGCALMDVQSDADHNRSVISFIGSPEAAAEAAFRLAKRALEWIDLNHHAGAHPRMGAVDVIPFIPIRGCSMDECVALSKRLGERLWKELALPVFLYERSASAPHRANLADVRRGQFEGMPEKLRLPEWAPDYGERRVHPTGGVVAVGARMPLIAFNINLGTDNVEIARAIARIIRQSSGGLAAVKALGIPLRGRGVAQVSVNLCDYAQTPLYSVLELVRAEARRYGVPVIGTEIVGLTPAAALIDSAAYYLMVEPFDPQKQVLDNWIS